ncbi:MAG: diguanylate cyclase [Pseudomonadales bacterium]|nr:diguanylate cyclase [Pseudomonadales bacterium]
MTDVDHFKRYNDVNGHPAGDQCLINVAQTLTSCAKRPTDFIGRFGGGEFIVVLPDTEHAGACKVANKIRQDILQRKMPYEANSLEYVSLTLGVVTVRGSHIKSIQQLTKEADKALYYGKSQGRNCVIGISLNEPEECHPVPEYMKCA